jgi:hypothetical protein
MLTAVPVEVPDPVKVIAIASVKERPTDCVAVEEAL